MNYDLDTDILARELLPPDKRKTNTIALVQSLLSSFQYARDYLFGAYYDDLKERILFNGSKLVLEYALNKQYGTTFVQPPGVSDIYITLLSPAVDGFLVGNDEAYCSAVGATDSPDWLGSIYTFNYLNHFQINLPSGFAPSQASVRDFTNKYVPASIKFTIVQL